MKSTITSLSTYIRLGKRPASLNKVKDMEMRQFIEKCLASASERLHAKELLKDPFLQIRDDHQEALDACHSVSSDSYDDMRDLYPAAREFPLQEGGVTVSDCNQKKLLAAAATTHTIELESPRRKVGWKRNRDFRIKVKQQDDKKILVRFRITSSRGVRYIQFDFDIETDAAMAVACEMVNELDLSDQDVPIIAGMIDAELISLLPDWRPRCSVGDVRGNDPQEERVLEALESLKLEADDDLGAPLVPLGPSDDPELTVPDSRNEVLVYGRFEEVGCNLVGSLHTQQDPDGLGSFSDFSSEHFEGAGSDLSLDASSDRLIAEKAGGSDLAMDAGFIAEAGFDDRLSMENAEGVSSDPPPLLRESCQPAGEESLKECLPFPAMDNKPENDVGPQSLGYGSELGSMPYQSAMDMEKLNNAGSCIIPDVPTKIRKLDKSKSMGTHTQPHPIPKCESASRDGDAGGDSVCKSVVSDALASSTEPVSKGVRSFGVKKEQVSASKRESYLEFYKAGVSQKDKAAMKNDAPGVSASVSKSDSMKDDDPEQVRKMMLQKSIANLEAKTLEGLSQSSSSYTVKSTSKGNAGAGVLHSQGHLPH